MYENLIILINTIISKILRILLTIIEFVSNMIFITYEFVDYNYIVIDNIVNYAGKNLSKYQTISYNVGNDPKTDLERIPKMVFNLGSGTYFFWYKNTLLWITVKHISKQDVFETELILRSFRWNNDQIKDFLEFIRKDSLKKSDSRIFSNRRHDGWYLEGSMAPRTLESVIIPQETVNKVIEDLDNFLKPDTLKFYEKRGLIYKRGLLLYGKPGCGKSSLVRALAQKYNYDLYDLNLNVDDFSFTSLMGRLPGKVILLFEDVDVAFPKRDSNLKATDKDRNQNQRSLTMKCFLNIVDGIKSRNNGVIMIFTTNHPENLDPALLRAGRIDLKVELGPLKREDIIRMFLVFFPNAEEYAEKAVNILKPEDKSDLSTPKDQEIIPAELYGFLVKNMYNTPEDVIAKLENEKWTDIIA